MEEIKIGKKPRMNTIRKCTFYTVFISAVLFAFSAQAASSLPGSAELQRLHDVLRSPELPMALPAEVIPKFEESAASVSLTEHARKVRFTLNTITVKGIHLYEPDAFMPLFNNLTGQEISVAELYELADAITSTYRNDGYILARAIVPPQDVTNGHASLQVIEGKLGNVTVEGMAFSDSALINAYAHKIKSGPLNTETLERYLLLMNDLPGVTAKSSLRPGAAPGESDLVISLDHTTIDGDYAWSNWGSRFLGPRQAEVNVRFNNLTHSLFNGHDRLEIRTIQTTNTKELTYIDVTETLPLGTEGTELKLFGSFSHSQPGYTLDPLELNSSTLGFGVRLEHPFIRTRSTTLRGFGELAWNNSKTKAPGGALLTHDKTRVARLGFMFDRADSWKGLTRLGLEVSKGLNIDAATQDSEDLRSRLRGTGTEFWKIRTDFARMQRLGKSWNLLVAGTSQWSTHALLSGEEIGIGGENYGRGYDTSEITGDIGFAAKTELQVNFPIGWKYFDSWQMFGFYDVGKVWNFDVAPNEENKAATLASYGVGIRANLGETLTAEITLAEPVSRPVLSQGEHNTNPTLYVRLKNKFSTQEDIGNILPW